jgi:outer membrane protein, heavy metal efflux system
MPSTSRHNAPMTLPLGFVWVGLCLLVGSLALACGSVAQEALPLPAPSAAEEKPVSLNDLVAAALQSNPEIQAADHRVAGLRARVPQAKSLPDPTVTVGWMGKPAPFVVNSAAPTSNRSVSAMQEFPFPGKLKLRGQVADRESQAAWWDYEAIRRRIVSQVKVAYFQYAYFHQALQITESNRLLLEQLTKIAEARYEAGKGLQQDVLKGQVELSQLLERITILTEQENTAVARLNTLLDRDPEAPLGPPEPLRQTKLTYMLDQLYRLAQSNDTGLQQAQSLIERDQDQVALARKSYDPDFTVSYMYQRMASGMNMNGAFVTLNIPIFYKSKQREAVREAAENLTSEKDSRADRQTTLNFLVKEQFLAARQADKLAVLFSQAIVPQSSQTLESSELAYETGKADFLTMLDNFTNLLDFQVNYYGQISDYQISLARLEPLVGVELAK